MIEVAGKTRGVTLDADTAEDRDDEAAPDTETVETLSAETIAIERWLTEGGRALAGKFDQ